MKKISTFVVGVLFCTAAGAQTINVHNTDNTVTKLSSGEVSYIEFEETVQGQKTSVVVEQVSGVKNVYSFTDSPQIRYADNVVKFTSSKNTLELDADAVSKVYLSKDENAGVESLEADAVHYFIADGHLAVSGLEAGSVVSLYNLDGVLLASENAGTDGKVSLSLLQSGTVVVKANNKSFKIITK